MTPIGYSSSESEDEMKLADCESTKPPSQYFIEQMQKRFFVVCLSLLFNKKTDSDTTFFVMSNQNFRVENKQVLVQTHAW